MQDERWWSILVTVRAAVQIYFLLLDIYTITCISCYIHYSVSFVGHFVALIQESLVLGFVRFSSEFSSRFPLFSPSTNRCSKSCSCELVWRHCADENNVRTSLCKNKPSHVQKDDTRRSFKSRNRPGRGVGQECF